MGRFTFTDTPLSGVKLIAREPIEDERGFFARFYCDDEFRSAGLVKPIAQMNHTYTRKKATVRGLHFQFPPHAETKIVSCITGKVFDVVVDLRVDSPTFLKWHGEVLSAENHKSILVPEGCAHGFQTLVDDCALIYLHTAHFHAAAEGGVNVSDPTLAIEWPLPISDLSQRDQRHAFIDAKMTGIRI